MSMKKFSFLLILVVGMLFNVNAVKAENLTEVIQDITVEKTNGSDGNFGQYENTTVKVYWEISDVVNENDTFSFSVSNNLFMPTNMEFDLISEDEEVMGVVNYNAATRMVTVTFGANSDGRMNFKGVITLKTRLNIGLSDVERVININFEYDNNIKEVPITVNPSPSINPNEKIYKWGLVSGNKSSIGFSIRINYEKSNVQNAVVSDSVGIGHEIDFSSFKVYKIYLNSVGGIISPEQLVDSSEYEVIEKNSHEFDLKLGDITDTYRIDYRTNITDQSLAAYANTAYLRGDNVTTAKVEISAITSNGSGVGSGDLGKIKIIKQDSENHNILLKDASFKLYNSNGDLVTEFSTDEEGSAQIINLKFGTYKLVESKAPLGYKIDTDPIIIDINNSDLKTYIIDNQLMKGKITLTKLGETNNPLANATFGIWSDDQNVETNTPIQIKTSNSKGYIEFDNLIPDEYKIKEISAPKGYILDNTIYNVTVINDDVLHIGNVYNELIKGSVSLLKVDENNNDLSGAIFGIWSENQDPNKDKPLKKMTSNPRIKFTKLALGKYIVKEISAPKGYRLDNKKYNVTLTSNNNEVNLGSIENKIIITTGDDVSKKKDIADTGVDIINKIMLTTIICTFSIAYIIKNRFYV